MDNILKAFLLAAGIIVSCVVIALTISTARSGSESSNIVSNRIYGATDDMAEADITKYDGLTVSGNDVLNAIKRLQHDITVVVTLSNGAVRTFDGVSNTITNDRTTALYINPLSSFTGSLTRDSNNALVSLNFKEV